MLTKKDLSVMAYHHLALRSFYYSPDVARRNLPVLCRRHLKRLLMAKKSINKIIYFDKETIRNKKRGSARFMRCPDTF